MSVCGGKILRHWQLKTSSYDIRAAVQSPCVKAFNNVMRGSAWGGSRGACSPSHRRSISYHLCIPLDVQMMKKGYHMMIDRKVSSIESSFRIEGMLFNEECRKRVKDVLTKSITVADAIAELNKKYKKMEDQEYNVLSDSEGT